MTESNNQDWVVIERSVAAPIETVWQMWTQPEHFAAWYGPMGASIPVADMDVRVGGHRRICMEMDTPGGAMQMWFAGEFREVTPNERLVYTDAMADETGAIAPAPEGHPESTDVVVELEELGSGTKMVMTHVGVPADSDGAGGWAMAFDKLDAHVSSLAS